MTEQSTNGANGIAANPPEALEQRAGATSAQVTSAETGAVPQTIGELVKRLALIEEAIRTTMKEGVDYGSVPGVDKPALAKPGAEKLAALFKLDVQMRNELVWGPAEHLTVISRATVYHAPTGARLGYGEGICTTRERKHAKRQAKLTCPACGAANIRKSRSDDSYYCWRKTDGCGATFPEGDQQITSQAAGEIDNPDLPDAWNPVDKLGAKRAFVDAVLRVSGASAFFTQDIGGDPADTEAAGLTYGPVVSGELKQQATQAAIKLCGGDVEHAKALWQKLQDGLDGYMPEAAARALVTATDSTAPPAAGNQTAAAPAHTPASAEPPTEQPPQPAGEAGQAHGAAAAAPPTANPHGERLRAIATGRGVSDADLANLIRNAVGQGPIPTDRARTALPEMLARITEEICEHTVALLDMFYPPPETTPHRAASESTSVDFSALEPPQTA